MMQRLGVWWIAEDLPEQPAIVSSESGSRTFGELASAAHRIVHALRSTGLGRGDVVAVLLPNDVQIVEWSLACDEAGLYFVMLNPHLSAAEITGVIEASGAKYPRVRIQTKGGEDFIITRKMQGQHAGTDSMTLGNNIKGPWLGGISTGGNWTPSRIATGMERTVAEVAELISAALAGRGIDMKITHDSPRLGDVKRNFADTRKAGKMLGWKPVMELEPGIEETIDYFMEANRID